MTKEIKKALNSANEKLTLDNVALTEMHLTRNRELMPIVALAQDKLQYLKYDENITVNVAKMHSKINNLYFLLLEYLTGVTILDEDGNSYAKIEVSVQAEYRSQLEISDEEAEVYGQYNGMIHVYPYIRHFIHNATKDAGLPPVVLPTQAPQPILYDD